MTALDVMVVFSLFAVTGLMLFLASK